MSHNNAFAGISGSVAAASSPTAQSSVKDETNQSSALLIDSSGRWGVRLSALPQDMARLLLQLLRDTAPVVLPQDAHLVRRVAAYDEAAARDPHLLEELERTAGRLNVMAFRVFNCSYMEITERHQRRALIDEIDELAIFTQLGSNERIRRAMVAAG